MTPQNESDYPLSKTKEKLLKLLDSMATSPPSTTEQLGTYLSYYIAKIELQQNELEKRILQLEIAQRVQTERELEQ